MTTLTSPDRSGMAPGVLLGSMSLGRLSIEARWVRPLGGSTFPPGFPSVLIITSRWPGRERFLARRFPLRKSRLVMDLELKRDAKSVIDRIVHLRDSL